MQVSPVQPSNAVVPASASGEAPKEAPAVVTEDGEHQAGHHFLNDCKWAGIELVEGAMEHI